MVVLDLEQEHERLRRLSDEHQARLHREISEANRRNSIENAQSLYELRAKQEAELKAQLRFAYSLTRRCKIEFISLQGVVNHVLRGYPERYSAPL